MPYFKNRITEEVFYFDYDPDPENLNSELDFITEAEADVILARVKSDPVDIPDPEISVDKLLDNLRSLGFNETQINHIINMDINNGG